MTDEYAVKASKVDFAYEGEPTILRFEKLQIFRGTIVTILGPSGCGKTTLLKLLSGIERPNWGAEILLDGMNVEEAVKAGRVSFSFQTPVLMPWRTASENLMLPTELRGKKVHCDKSVEDERRKTLQRLRLVEDAEKYPGELSSGMRSRVAVGQAMLSGASVHFMDEVFGTLDEANRVRMNLGLRTLNEREMGATILFVTHSIDEAILLGDRVLVLAKPDTARQSSIIADYPVKIQGRNKETRYQRQFEQLKREIEGILPQEDYVHEAEN